MNASGLLLIPQVDLTFSALLLASVRTYGLRRQVKSGWLLLASLMTLTLGLTAALNAASQMIMAGVNYYMRNVEYDFNVYSVMLIGGASLWLGWKLVNISGCVARGDRDAWKKSARYTIALLLVVSPMGPFQPYAYAAASLGFISLAGLEMARPSLSVSQKACAERAPARRNTRSELRTA